MSIAVKNTKWDANLYDDKHSFVFKYGEDLVQLLDPKPGENILDVGCGTGYLTNLIAETGAHVIGIDNSPDMIEKAKAEYPEIGFEVLSATDFHFEKNSMLFFQTQHCIGFLKKKKQMIACMKI